MTETGLPAPAVTMTGLPDSCPYCDVTAAEVTEWLLGVQGNMLQVICPRCFTAIAPVRAVAAKPGPHYHDSAETEPCWCPSPLTYSPQEA